MLRPVLSITGVVVGLALGCSPAQPETKPLREEYERKPCDLKLEFVFLTKEPDETHRSPVAEANGETWYRGSESILDMSSIALANTIVRQNPDETWFVALAIREKEWPNLRYWTARNIGAFVGWVAGDEILFVAQLEHFLSTHAAIQLDGTYESARVLCDKIVACAPTD